METNFYTIAAYALTDWAIHAFAPRYLRVAGLSIEAEKLQAAPRIDSTTYAEVQAILKEVRAVTINTKRAPWETAGRFAVSTNTDLSTRVNEETERLFCAEGDLRDIERVLRSIAMPDAWGQALAIAYEAIRTIAHKEIANWV